MGCDPKVRGEMVKQMKSKLETTTWSLRVCNLLNGRLLYRKFIRIDFGNYSFCESVTLRNVSMHYFGDSFRHTTWPFPFVHAKLTRIRWCFGLFQYLETVLGINNWGLNFSKFTKVNLTVHLLDRSPKWTIHSSTVYWAVLKPCINTIILMQFLVWNVHKTADCDLCAVCWWQQKGSGRNNIRVKRVFCCQFSMYIRSSSDQSRKRSLQSQAALVIDCVE